MTRLTTLCLICCLGLTTFSVAQDEAEAPTPYWYVSYYEIDWAKTDSLFKLWEKTQPVRDLQVERGEMLAWIPLVHHSGQEHNVVMMTKYPSWAAMNADSDAFRTVFTDSTERSMINSGFNWVFGDGAHDDVIYGELPGAILPDPQAEAEGYWYASYYEMPFGKIDSLNTMMGMLAADVNQEAVNNGSITGTLSLVHHTGKGPTLVQMSRYSTWDALENRSNNGALAKVVPDESKRQEYIRSFQYIYQGAPHYDAIYAQPINR